MLWASGRAPPALRQAVCHALLEGFDRLALPMEHPQDRLRPVRCRASVRPFWSSSSAHVAPFTPNTRPSRFFVCRHQADLSLAQVDVPHVSGSYSSCSASQGRDRRSAPRADNPAAGRRSRPAPAGSPEPFRTFLFTEGRDMRRVQQAPILQREAKGLLGSYLQLSVDRRWGIGLDRWGSRRGGHRGRPWSAPCAAMRRAACRWPM